MPFQDVEDEVSEEQIRTPSSVEKFLRKVFVEDWSLKLLSLAIAVVLWLAVTTQNEPVTTHVNVQLNFLRPQSLEISNDPPKSVDVTLTGSRNKLDSLSALDLVATIDITDQRAGERVLRLSEKAQLSLPQGVRIDGFLPGAVTVRLEPIIEKQLEITTKLDGEPAQGYEVYSTRVDPRLVTVRGPASHVNAVGSAPTETVWLAGQKESFTATNIAIDIPDPKVHMLDSDVDVHIEIGEKRAEKTFADVTITTPANVSIQPRVASITLIGPQRLLEGLKKDEIKLLLNESSEPRLELSGEYQGKVFLKSTNPAKFQLR